MIIIRHRRNTLEELLSTPKEQGIEVDIRSQGEELIIHHDPFVSGERFENWLEGYAHRFLILNVKEEGLEQRLIALMREKNIENYFFLDQSFPFLVRTAATGEKRCAVRVSEYEAIDTALSLAGKIDWVWVDCFNHFPLNRSSADTLRKAGFKLCLVSPELQGRTGAAEIQQIRTLLDSQGIEADAVCTKEPDLW